MTALTPTASTASSASGMRPPSSRWKGSTSPETSTSASISVWVSARRALADAPIASSSNVTLQ